MMKKNIDEHKKDYLILIGFYVITIFGSFAVIS